jgi:hypothetical protein
MDCSSIFFFFLYVGLEYVSRKKKKKHKGKKYIETSNIAIYNCRSRKLKVNVQIIGHTFVCIGVKNEGLMLVILLL